MQNIRQVDQAKADLQDEIMKANMAAGRPGHGPGIILTLNDSNRTLQSGETPTMELYTIKNILTLVMTGLQGLKPLL